MEVFDCLLIDYQVRYRYGLVLHQRITVDSLQEESLVHLLSYLRWNWRLERRIEPVHKLSYAHILVDLFLVQQLEVRDNKPCPIEETWLRESHLKTH